MATRDSVQTQLRQGIDLLRSSSREAQRDASLLLCHTLGKDRAWLLAHPESGLTDTQSAQYQALLARRLQHEPIQYILGEQEFYGLRLTVTPAVLIPRPETEHLVEAVLERVPHDCALRIADVGTGSGAIALALASALPQAHIDALDISEDALAVAKKNAQTLGLSERVCFFRSDLLDAAPHRHYDAVVSNPPYVASTESELELLEPQVRDWEPHGALFAGPDGLDVYRRLIPQALAVLRPEGLFAVELGAGQEAPLRALFAAVDGWRDLAFLPDLQGIPRVAVSRKRDA
jgi:release factor glutamine methyltransferase